MSMAPKITLHQDLKSCQVDDLIKEIKSRGFLVIKREKLRTVSASNSTDIRHHRRMKAQDFEQVVLKGLANSLAHFLVHEYNLYGNLSEYRNDPARVEHRLTMDVIVHEVSPEDIDYPLYLQRRD